MSNNDLWCNYCTLRDYFAAKAMQGIIADGAKKLPAGVTTSEMAYKLADAMLKEREK